MSFLNFFKRKKDSQMRFPDIILDNCVWSDSWKSGMENELIRSFGSLEFSFSSPDNAIRIYAIIKNEHHKVLSFQNRNGEWIKITSVPGVWDDDIAFVVEEMAKETNKSKEDKVNFAKMKEERRVRCEKEKLKSLENSYIKLKKEDDQ